MDPSVSLDSLRGLSQDLSLFKNGGRPGLESLLGQLDAHIGAISTLLDKKPRSAASRKTLSEGKVTLGDVSFEINKEFQEQVIQLADALDLDEIEATRLYLEAQEESQDLERNPAILAVIAFHQYRVYLLDCLRRVCELYLNEETDDQHKELFENCVKLIVGGSGIPGPQGLTFVKRCMTGMADMESWLQRIAEQVQKNVALNTTTDADVDEMLHTQQEMLIRQHEYMALIVAYLVKSNRSVQDDFITMMSHVSRLDKWNMVTIHYVPSLLAFISHYGSAETHNIHFDDVQLLHQKIVGARDSGPWPVRHLQAAFISWWLAEYNGWFFDQGAGAQSDSNEARDQRESAFSQALEDGAFQCTLSICTYLKSHDWLDPSRLALTRSLLTEALSLPGDAAHAEDEFRDILMEQLETFIDAFVTNMPDTLRKFKAEEDDERRKLLAGLANGNSAPGSHVLETFFLVVSYAYEGRPNSAENFWDDAEGNLYGFLQWASRRQSTPVVSAFCEMFRALSEGDHADAAHRFLLEEFSGSSSRMRKSATLNWSEIFDELTYYADKIKLNPAPVSSSVPGGRSVMPEFDEPESIEMLECYLRLIAHLCRQSLLIRLWFLGHPSFHIVEVSLLLCRSNSPVRIRICAYGCLEALLTDKSQETSDLIWAAVDKWITSEFCSKPPNKVSSSLPIEEIALRTIAANAEEASAFTSLLTALVTLPSSVGPLADRLPFPEQLGSTYRMPGLDAYIDFVFGKLFCQTLPSTQGSLQAQVLAYKILTFAVICLDSFNEDLVILANQPGVNVESGMLASSLTVYARLHPFNRIMEWMFNENAVKVLFGISHHDIGELNAFPPEAPTVASVYYSILLITKAFDLQPTFLNVIRPLLKSQPYRNDRENVVDASMVFFEDSIATNLRIVPDLLYYSGSNHEELTMASMRLLTKITRSRKLNAHAPVDIGQRTIKNRLISVLEQHHDVEPIASALVQRMTFDAREFAASPSAPGYQAKMAVLDFLETTLSDVPDRPNVAHILLGLDSIGNSLSVTENSRFANGDSLFHTIVRLAIEYPESPAGTLLEWTLGLKQKVWHIVELLWSSSVSSAPILADLRDNGYIASRWTAQVILNSRTLFDGYAVADDFFYFKAAPDAYVSYLEQRKALLNYTSAELRLAASQELELLRAQITSTILGMTPTEEGNIQNANIFDLLDFMELEIPLPHPISPHQWYAGLEDKIEAIVELADNTFDHRLAMISKMLALRHRELERGSYLHDDNDRKALEDLHNTTLLTVAGREKQSIMQGTRLSLLKAWVNLMNLFLEHAVLEENDKRMFILQALQITSPKLELFASQAQPEALVFAELAQILLGHLKMAPAEDGTQGKGTVDDGMSERLSSLFRVSLRTICMPTTEADLRTALYHICYRYLTNPMGSEAAARCIPTIKTMGEGLLDAICEDAYNGDFTCRVAALMLLEELVVLESQHKSMYVTDNMVRANFVVVLVENIKEMPQEAQQTSPGEVASLMLFFKSKLALLLALARTRAGAGHVVNAGLFSAVTASGLFATDPDLGLDIDSPDALQRYYELLLGVLQVVVAVVLSRGGQNAHTLEQARSFLLANRALMIGLLKRQARIGLSEGEGNETVQQTLNDLSELYVLLISCTGFVEQEEERDTHKSRRQLFS